VADDKQVQLPQYPVNAAHLMRTTQLAQLQLSAMADTKASILMGATFVIFTITIGKAQGSSAPIPLLILGGAAFFRRDLRRAGGSALTRKGKPTAESNILFFGVFTQMKEDEFIDSIVSCLHTDDSIYRTMARDIYQAGMVLQKKKYRLLSYAYRTLLIGLVASCVAYIILYVLYVT
jgi:hypothetical protein